MTVLGRKHSALGRIAGLFAGCALACCLLAPSVDAASRPAVAGSGGAVTSDEALATEVGLDILRAGGNAVDAAVATALALAVVAPEAGNLGGGGFAVVRMGDEVAFLDFRETAPAAAHPDLYLDDEGEPIAEASIIGPLSAGVPGSPRGLHALHERFGALPWRRVVEPARDLAALGFALSRRAAATIADEADLLSRFPETAGVWMPEGRPLEAGARVELPTLAASLEAYADEGPAAFESGARAAAIEAASTRHGGILTAADLAAYRPVWRQPVRFRAFGWDVASADLPSSGGILLGSSATMLEGLDPSPSAMIGAERAHRLAEVWRRAYADRMVLGDPAEAAAGPAELLAPAWLERRMADFDPTRRTPSAEVAAWDRVAAERGAGPKPESLETTHLSTLDAAGGAVALTTTLNGAFGSGLWVPEVGYFLNNEMDDFTTAPGRPNLYGLVQGEANLVRAGRRMLSSMSPTVAWRGSEVVALGGRGGSRIPTATFQVLLHLWRDGDGLQAALDRPRVHHQWLPDQLFHEPDALSPETRAALEALGHELAETESLAQVHAVRLRADGLAEAAADPRGGGGVPGIVRPLD